MTTKKFVASYFLKLHLHHFSKIKSNKEVTKQSVLRVFFLLLLDYRRIRRRIRTYLVLKDPKQDSGGPKTYGSCGSATLPGPWKLHILEVPINQYYRYHTGVMYGTSHVFQLFGLICTHKYRLHIRDLGEFA
jgi:hypothetical protein